MDFYKRMLIKIIEGSASGEDSRILRKLKSGQDLNQSERRELEELIDNLI